MGVRLEVQNVWAKLISPSELRIAVAWLSTRYPCFNPIIVTEGKWV